MEFPKSNAVRVTLLVVLLLFWLSGDGINQFGLPIWTSFLAVVALAVTGAFGVWGIAAVVIGTALHGSRGPILPLLIALALVAARLGIMMTVIRRMMPQPSKDGLIRLIPIAVLLNYGLWLGAVVLQIVLSGHFGAFSYLRAGNLIASPILQLLFAFLVGLPLYRWIEGKGGFDEAGAVLAGAAAGATKSLPAMGSAVMAGGGASKPASDSGFAVAEYGIPHCKYEETAEGFIVRFNRTHVGFHRGADKLQAEGSGSALNVATALPAMLILLTAWLFHKSTGGTVIEVTKEAVIIDKKKMRREDFFGFNVDHSYQSGVADRKVATLGYSFGNRTFAFGGSWPDGQAEEVAAALNSFLRRTPMAGDELKATPESLRTARPTDF